MLSAVVVGAPKRLDDRALPRFETRCTFEDDRSLCVVTVLHERLPSLQQLVGGLVVLHRIGVGRQVAIQSRRSTRCNRGLGVSPGMRPRLAIGLPSISLRSPVKSIGVAPLMKLPTANESTGAPASLNVRIRSGVSPPEPMILTCANPAWSSRARTSRTRSGVTRPRSAGV